MQKLGRGYRYLHGASAFLSCHRQVCSVFFAVLFSIFSVSGFASGVAGSATSAPCDNATLETYSGDTDLQVTWEPNTVNIRWYNGETQLTVQDAATTCVYDDDLYLPAAPTKKGYTFKGWTVIDVPAGYTKLEYLESTGTQYIDTGVVLTSNNITYEWEAKDNDTSGSTSLFGSEYGTTSSNRSFSGIPHGNNTGRSGYVGSGSVSMGYSSSDGQFHSWVWVVKSDHTTSLTKDGTTFSTRNWSGNVNNSISVILYANRYYSGSVTQQAKVAYKYFRIIDNGQVVFNGIPVRRNSDGVLGMYDTVSGELKTNRGSGTFGAGPAVK